MKRSLRRHLDTLVRVCLAPGAIDDLSASARGVFGDAAPDAAVLDVGCGFLSPLLFAGLRTIGVDIGFERVRAHAGAGGVVADAEFLPFDDGCFDTVASMGLLHHLDHGHAKQAIAEMLRVTRPGGTTIIFDGVRPASGWRRPFAAIIRSLDFGGHMRNEAQLRGLFFDDALWRFERITYARTKLEGLWCVRVKPELQNRRRHEILGLTGSNS